MRAGHFLTHSSRHVHQTRSKLGKLTCMIKLEFLHLTTHYGPTQSNGMCLLDFPAQSHL